MESIPLVYGLDIRFKKIEIKEMGVSMVEN